MEVSDFKKQFQELFEAQIAPEDSSGTKRWKDIYTLVCPNIPEMLFRYRSIDAKGYALKSLKEGTICMCHAGMFPDKYDSFVYVNRKKIRDDMRSALRSALRFTLLQIPHNAMNLNPEKVRKVLFYRRQGLYDEQIIDIIIENEYSDFCDLIESGLKSKEERFRHPNASARIACFTESVQSKYMWDRYGGGYKGFALGYDFRDFISKYAKSGKNVNLLPVIYSDLRPDVTDAESNIFVYEYLKNLGDWVSCDFLRQKLPVNPLHWYRSYLYKDKNEYEHEREWRMLYYNLEEHDDYASITDCDCLKAIYYGPDINEQNKTELHRIAVEKGLKEYDVNVDSESQRYDLRVTELGREQ